MTVDLLPRKLDGVRQVAAARWRARCPAHDGKNTQVLSIGEANDVHAVGLELADLFPRLPEGKHAAVGRRLNRHAVDQSNHLHLIELRRPRVDWLALIVACERDLLLVKIVLTNIAQREPINDTDAEACRRAATRVYQLIDEARHR